MPVPLLDLKAQYQVLRDQIRAEVDAIMDSQQFILGPKVEAFEKAICDYTGANHAIGVTSGTDALLVVLMALGIGEGDAVITTPFTFFGTAGSIARTGATPVFIDIDEKTFNLSPSLLKSYLDAVPTDAEGRPLTKEGKRIKAIMPVHLYGLCAAMDEIMEAASRFNLPVIEDAAQALGSEYLSAKQGRKQAGAIADFGCYSFFPSKNLGAFGDGGMVVCKDAAAAETIRALRNHGGERRYFHRLIGGNFRLDALQAAILQIKLPSLDLWSERRRGNALLYREAFAKAGLCETISLPVEPYAKHAEEGLTNHHIYNQFVIRAPRRDALCTHLEALKIGHAIYYPLPLHLQECFAYLGYQQGDFPNSEKASLETLALPIFPELEPEQIEAVVKAIADFYH